MENVVRAGLHIERVEDLDRMGMIKFVITFAARITGSDLDPEF